MPHRARAARKAGSRSDHGGGKRVQSHAGQLIARCTAAVLHVRDARSAMSPRSTCGSRALARRRRESADRRSPDRCATSSASCGLGRRYWRVPGLVAERTFRDGKAETEAPRAPTLESIEQGVLTLSSSSCVGDPDVHAILWVDMKHRDPSALLAHCSGPFCPIAIDHFARLATRCDRRDGAISMVGEWNGGAAHLSLARSTCRFEERCSMACLDPVARFRLPAPWPHGLASHGRAWLRPTISWQRKAMSKAGLDRGHSSVPIFGVSFPLPAGVRESVWRGRAHSPLQQRPSPNSSGRPLTRKDDRSTPVEP